MNLSFWLFFLFCFAFPFFLFPTSIRMRVSLTLFIKKKTSRLGLNGRKRVRGRRSQKKKWKGERKLERRASQQETPPTPCVSLLSLYPSSAWRHFRSDFIFFFNQFLPRCTSVVLSFRNKQEHTYSSHPSFIMLLLLIFAAGSAAAAVQTPSKRHQSPHHLRRTLEETDTTPPNCLNFLLVFSSCFHTRPFSLSPNLLMCLVARSN